MHLARFVLVVVLALMDPRVVVAQGASDESIRQYLKLSGQEASAIENMNGLVVMMRSLSKDVPEDQWQELTRSDNVVAFVIPVYRRYFSEQEMQDLIAFHSTPTGSKLGALAATIQSETAELGAKQAQAAISNYWVQKRQSTVEPQK
jgi:uncharacterized protein